jgi:hypothetical protein
MQNFNRKQLEALDALKSVYPSGIWIEPEGRPIFDSLIDRGSGLVELIDSDETPSGDAYRLTDQGAEAFRENVQHADRN